MFREPLPTSYIQILQLIFFILKLMYLIKITLFNKDSFMQSILIRILSFLTPLKVLFLICITSVAVSYTHLDVYKRQQLN